MYSWFLKKKPDWARSQPHTAGGGQAPVKGPAGRSSPRAQPGSLSPPLLPLQQWSQGIHEDTAFCRYLRGFPFPPDALGPSPSTTRCQCWAAVGCRMVLPRQPGLGAPRGNLSTGRGTPAAPHSSCTNSPGESLASPPGPTAPGWGSAPPFDTLMVLGSQEQDRQSWACPRDSWGEVFSTPWGVLSPLPGLDMKPCPNGNRSWDTLGLVLSLLVFP